MTWTYVGPATSDRDKVRFLIQDVETTRQLMSDEEIAWLISEWGDVYEAAANAAEALAAKFTGKADYSKSVGDLSLNETFSSQSAGFKELAKNIRSNRHRKYTVSWVANAEALKSTADRTVTTYNTDAFTGQMDNPRTSTSESSLQ
jgi:hypothetical protein